MVLNKTLHNRYLSGSKYASSFEYASVIQGSFHITRVLLMHRLEYTRFVNMSMLHRGLCKIYFKDSRCLECLEF